MKRPIILSAAIAVLLSACSSPPKAMLVAEGDNTIQFDRSGTFAVSTQSDTVEARNITSSLRDVLTEAGYRIAGAQKNDYILTINPIRKTYTYTAHNLVGTNSTASGQIGSDSFSLSGTSYTLVPYTATATFEGFVAALYDWKLDQNPILMWRGVIAADDSEIKDHEVHALRLLVSNLGQSAHSAVNLEDGDAPAPSPPPISSQPSDDAIYFFPSSNDTVNSMQGTFSGHKYLGYIRTRQIKTNRFDGYVQNTGSSEFKGTLLSTDEMASWDIGLGAYVLKADGIYTENQPSSLRDLDSYGLQKIISFPLRVGARNEIQIAGSAMSITVDAKEAAQTPYGPLNDCYKLRRDLSRGTESESDFIWVCRGVGIVRIKHSTGRDDVLVNVQVTN